MDKQEILERIHEEKLSSLVVLAGFLNAAYSIAVGNWLGLLISTAVVFYLLPYILREN